MVIGPDLELGVEVEIEIDKACESCGRMAGRERLQRIVYGVHVASAHTAIVHDIQETITRSSHVGLTHGKKVGSQTTDEPFQEDLENSSGNQTVQKTDNCIVGIPERAYADLHQ